MFEPICDNAPDCGRVIAQRGAHRIPRVADPEDLEHLLTFCSYQCMARYAVRKGRLSEE